MLTEMTDAEWEIVVEVFRAARSRRGGRGQDDRKFLEALHYFAVHNLTWRALPTQFGKWNSIWKRFWRLSQRGVFEAMLALLAETSSTAHLVQMVDSTIVRAHVSAAGAKGGTRARHSGARAVGFPPRSTSRCDFDGLPLAFHLTGGEASDSRNFETLLDLGPDIAPRAVIGDKGYDARQTAKRHAGAASAPSSRTAEIHRQAEVLPACSL